MGFPGKGRDNILRKWNFMFSNSAAKNLPNLFEIVRRGGRKCVYKVDRHRPIKNRLIFFAFLVHHVGVLK